MNLKLSKKQVRMFLLLACVLLFTGCTRIQGTDGQILPEKIIYFTGENFTTWKSMFENESWFSAIFVWPMAQLVNFFAQYMNVALSVILVTILSRLITAGFTVKSTVMSQKMQMIQPEMSKIQAKYAGRDDEQSKLAQSQEMMALYNKHNINPMSSIASAFIPFPIMIAIWQAVQRAESVVFGSFFTISASEKPMTAITTDFTGAGWKCLILIVILGIVQFASMKFPQYLARKNMKERDREAAKQSNAQQNTMTYSMFIMIVFMSISMPVAMSFYWIVSAGVQIVQTYIIQKKYVENK